MKIYSREERQALVDEGRITFDEMRDLQLANIEDMLITLTQKKKRKPQQSRVEYPEWFEHIWLAYPRRKGSNPKNKAYSAIKARCQAEGETNALLVRMFDGTQAYYEFCRVTKKIDTELVMQAQRFFGPSQEYLSDWSIPTKSTLPSNDEELQAWASKNGHRQAHPGESYKAYRAYLESES